MKYPENKKKAPMKPVTKELPMMKSETIELKKATKELAVINTIQMTRRKKRNAL